MLLHPQPDSRRHRPGSWSDHAARFTGFRESTQQACRRIIQASQSGVSMSCTKAQLIESLMAGTGYTRKKSTELVESLLDIMKGALEAGEDVLISGFGKFRINRKQARRGRNPATGGQMMLRPRKVVTFKCAGQLKDRINE
jgi:integration host factor subunit alpha